MSYFLFLLVTATLFIRPGEIIQSTQGWPIYEILILACLATSISPVLNQLSTKSLSENPITACVVGLLVAIVLSHLAYLRTFEARETGKEFLKVVIYYLLLVATIDSETRLRSVLRWLLLFITVVATLAVLAAQHVIELPSIEFLAQTQYDKTTGAMVIIPRLQATGIFQDPNDLAMILVAGVAIAFYLFNDRASGLLRFVGLPLAAFFMYSIYLTQSRGGLLALMAVLIALGSSRWGWRRTAWVAAIALPVFLAAFGGRMTSYDDAMAGGTGQSRVELWSAGLQAFKQRPLFGIGMGNYADEAGQVAHNSFVHAFTELGLFGGTLFLGAFISALTIIHRLGCDATFDGEAELRRVVPYLKALIVGFTVSMFSLSRNYVVPTYLVLGLATSCERIATGKMQAPALRFDSPLLKRFAFGSVCFLVGIYIFIRVSARWS